MSLAYHQVKTWLLHYSTHPVICVDSPYAVHATSESPSLYWLFTTASENCVEIHAWNNGSGLKVHYAKVGAESFQIYMESFISEYADATKSESPAHTHSPCFGRVDRA